MYEGKDENVLGQDVIDAHGRACYCCSRKLGGEFSNVAMLLLCLLCACACGALEASRQLPEDLPDACTAY